ncbi:membrane protein [Kitasatospora herbaricolor]|uniref:ComEC/Rec2 family competence protein n=1 Tax=Kitasatospora herbaricolor TaxID=68217 RepID=UPI00198CF789|nr:ComEC/Rec2 family competence protein [Kitasatospora herbaricolor]MDQ0308266.1 competence protein ComEC [Kitasatospora herbaricolor]GGV06382.1 membrane protein [Kitasatospora herbaricolor]
MPAADLRLLLPAASAWGAAAAVLHLVPGQRPAAAVAACLLAVVATVLLLLRRGFQGRAAATLAAVLLTAATATATTLLHTADLHRGPLPALARPESAAAPPQTAPGAATATSPSPARSPAAGAELRVELTITGDPKSRTSRARGTAPGQSLVTVEAVADQVAVPGAGGRVTVTRGRTPVLVMVRAQDAGPWLPLLPSTRLAAEVRVLPAGEGFRDSAAVLLAHGPPRPIAGPSLPQRIAGRLRAGLRAACDGLPADARGLLPGLVVGDTSRLPDDLREDFRATDLTHLTAVSGANLAILLAVLLGAPGRAGTPERRGLAALLGLSLRKTALLGTAVTLAFVTVCRPDPSVLRAAATGLIGLLALASGRPRHALPALSGAVLVLVLLDPELARSYGFLLSVLATAGLLVLGPRWAAALRARGWPGPLATGVAAATAAQALCAPVTVLLAPRVSLVAVPCNLLAEVAVAPATLLGFAVLALEPLAPSPARLLACVAGIPAGWLATVARVGASLPGAQLAWPGGLFGAGTLIVATLAACWAAPLLLPPPTAPGGVPGPRGVRSRRVRVLSAAVLALTLLLVLLRPPALTRIATGWPPEGWRLAMCDVGQGDMLVLPVLPEDRAGAVADGAPSENGASESGASESGVSQSGVPDGNPPDSAVVVDAGPDPRAADACLRSLGITRVPLLLLTHFHADHVEGVPGVLRGRQVGAVETTVLDEPPAEAARVRGWATAAGVPLLRAGPGEHRTAGPGLSWEVLWPAGEHGVEAPGANNASVALLVTLGRAGGSAGGLRVALLGDLEPPAQAALLAGRGTGRVDILKVAHHGSAHQDRSLAAALRPRLALISCGRDNPYGHPAPRTVEHLRELGATVLRTDLAGDVAVVGDTPATLGALTRPHDREAGSPR